MKKCFILALFLPVILRAQFSPQVFASAGFEATTASGFSVNFTIGEAIIASVENPKNHISQGFHQGLLQKCQALAFSHPALAFPDPAFDSCEIKIALTGSIYPNFTGEWLDSTGLFLGDTPDITVPIDTGENRFAWQLSEKQCPAYATVDQRVYRGLKADAKDDYPFFYMEIQPFGLVVSANDSLLEASFDAGIISASPAGFVFSNGQLPGEFILETGKFEGELPLLYFVANNGYCKKRDTATIFLRVQKLYGLGFNDGITPNDDCLNETFKLCDTLDCSIDLKIFNRWGNLVFEAKNYQNDWKGANNNGKPLPAGTYFYQAKINSSERRGAVTVLR